MSLHTDDNDEIKKNNISQNEPTPPIPTQHKKEEIPFWATDPNVLLNKEHIFEFYPVESMSLNQKLNAISRTIILLTIISFFFTYNVRLIIVCFFTLLAIYALHKHQQKEKKKKEGWTDGRNPKSFFKDPTLDLLIDKGVIPPDSKHLPINNDIYQLPTTLNPMSNVLISDYDYNPNKKPAPPSYNENINKDILSKAKEIVQINNSEQPNISEKLFKDLGEQLNFEQSMRPFHSTASTTIPNDQGAFAEFCFGSMISAKEGNMFAATRNLSHYNLY